jgi:hypothetical protein
VLHAGHRIGLALVTVAVGACRSHPASQAASTAQPTRKVAADDGPAKVRGPAQPAPAVRVTANTGAHGELAVSVRNHAAAPVEIAPALRVERAEKQGFEPVADVALSSQAGVRCVRLAPGAELQPSAPADDRLRASGTYRVVLNGCEDSYRIDSEPFQLP